MFLPKLPYQMFMFFLKIVKFLHFYKGKQDVSGRENCMREEVIKLKLDRVSHFCLRLMHSTDLVTVQATVHPKWASYD